MTEESTNDAVLRLLELIGERLENYLEGDETALETLGESIDQRGFSVEDMQAAILVLRSLGGSSAIVAPTPHPSAPGKHALRVPSAEERERFTPEAWGYLLGLRRSGSLDAEQFERVIDLLNGSGVRAVDVEVASEVAARVALEFDPSESAPESDHGEFDITH